MTDSPTAKNYFFEDFEIDASRNLLLHLPERESVSLTRKAFQVLLLLVENRGDLVSKDDLTAKVWEDSFVEEANLTQTISVLRRTLGENPNQHRFIVTETGKGYRFVAPVKESNGSGPTLRADPEDKPVAESSKKSDRKKSYRITFWRGVLRLWVIKKKLWKNSKKLSRNATVY